MPICVGSDVFLIVVQADARIAAVHVVRDESFFGSAMKVRQANGTKKTTIGVDDVDSFQGFERLGGDTCDDRVDAVGFPCQRDMRDNVLTGALGKP